MTSSQQSSPQSLVHPPDDLAAIAAQLEQAAQALHEQARALLDVPLPVRSAPPVLDDNPGEAHRDPVSPDIPHIRRCYSIPAFMLDEERDLLDAYDADDLADLLDRLYVDLHVTATLMEHVDIEMETDGEFIHMLGTHLRATLRFLHRVSSVLGDFKLISRAETASA